VFKKASGLGAPEQIATAHPIVNSIGSGLTSESGAAWFIGTYT